MRPATQNQIARADRLLRHDDVPLALDIRLDGVSRDATPPLIIIIMVFTKRLREGVRKGRIRCSVRIWTHPHVKAGGRYPMDEGHIVVDSIVQIRRAEITADLARESGFSGVKDLLETAQHGRGRNIYLIRFHYLMPGAWDRPLTAAEERKEGRTTSELLRRIHSSAPPAAPRASRRRGA